MTLDAEDIVLEVGPGLGVLTRYLADHVRVVHAVELDRSLEPALRDALGARTNVDLVWGDALAVDFGALSPAPTKLVANLPYNIATPLVVETLEHVESLRHWCVMVQREVADRFFAAATDEGIRRRLRVGSTECAEDSASHPVPPTVFRPRPRVESRLVAFERAAVAPIAEVRAVVEGSFAHRRKTLVNSLVISGLAGRQQAEAAVRAAGHATNARAEELAPREFVRLAEVLR